MSIELKDEQKLVFDKYIQGENIFITGPGGTGKTHLIKEIVNHAKENNKSYKVCAMTGCAAILLMCGATTLHSFAGIGLATGTINEVIERVLKSRYKRANWYKTDLLIIDEVSMLSLKLFIILDLIAKKIKKKPHLPFGGMQIIFAGDFYQLPPIGDENDPQTLQFCFETDLWNETFSPKNQIELKTMYRQTDTKYIKILNYLRVGKITKSTISILEECIKKDLKELKPTRLVPRRRDADTINNEEFNKLDNTNEKTYKMTIVPETELILTREQLQNLSIFTNKERQYEIEYLKDNIMAEQEIAIKIGTVVMCIANLNIDSPHPIVNGSQGIVIDYVNDYPLVKFNNGVTQIMGPYIWQSEKIPGIAIKQIPLIYAWAITIHKAQGVTLEQAWIDIGVQIFEYGQTYVALSRLKSLAGLFLKSFDYTKIRVNPKVKQFYNLLILS
jgi:ATP-dependent DNA helicase PIF1